MSAYDYDVLVVGGGPAGLSAALTLSRACRSVLLCDAGPHRNAVSRAVHGFLSRDGINPEELRAIGRQQLAPYGAVVTEKAVLNLAQDVGGWRATLDGQREQVRVRAVLLATGMADTLPDLPGFMELYGVSAHHCPYCDGWEHRGQVCAVYCPGHGIEYAINMLAWTSKVIYLEDGTSLRRHEAARLRTNGVEIVSEKVTGLVSGRDGKLQQISLRDASPVSAQVLFFHLGMVQSSGLPERLGCRMSSGFVAVDPAGRTSVRGVYAAGDLTPGPQSVSFAAAEGAAAAAAMHQDMHRAEVK